MSDVFAQNELIASKRRALMLVTMADGVTPAPRGTSFTGCVTIDQSTGIYIAATGTLTNNAFALTFSDQTFTYSSGNNVVATAHPFESQDGPVYVTTTGTLPGITVATPYWLIVDDANDVSFASTLANAIAGTKITLSGTPTGTMKITATGVPSPGPLRPIDGSWTYVATQAETDFVGSELVIRIDKATFAPSITHVGMGSAIEGFESIGEGSNLYGDILRDMYGTLCGLMGNFTTGSYAAKDPSTGTKVRRSYTSDATGRFASVKGDLTP